MTRHVLVSEQGYKFTLSYDTKYLNFATDFRVEISGRPVCDNALVRLINRYGGRIRIEDAHATSEARLIEPIDIGGNAPQIAFCVDGDWQRDPVQHGAHNFNFVW